MSVTALAPRRVSIGNCKKSVSQISAICGRLADSPICGCAPNFVPLREANWRCGWCCGKNARNLRLQVESHLVWVPFAKHDFVRTHQYNIRQTHREIVICHDGNNVSLQQNDAWNGVDRDVVRPWQEQNQYLFFLACFHFSHKRTCIFQRCAKSNKRFLPNESPTKQIGKHENTYKRFLNSLFIGSRVNYFDNGKHNQKYRK